MSKAEKKVGMWNCGFHAFTWNPPKNELRAGLTPYRSLTRHELFSYRSETVPF